MGPELDDLIRSLRPDVELSQPTEIEEETSDTPAPEEKASTTEPAAPDEPASETDPK